MATVRDNRRWLEIYESLADKFSLTSRPRISNRRLLLTYTGRLDSSGLYQFINSIKPINKKGSIVVGYSLIFGVIETHVCVDFGDTYMNAHHQCEHVFDYIQPDKSVRRAHVKVINGTLQWSEITEVLSGSISKLHYDYTISS